MRSRLFSIPMFLKCEQFDVVFCTDWIEFPQEWGCSIVRLFPSSAVATKFAGVPWDLVAE